MFCLCILLSKKQEFHDVNIEYSFPVIEATASCLPIECLEESNKIFEEKNTILLPEILPSDYRQTW